jgi:hypothetical protein
MAAANSSESPSVDQGQATDAAIQGAQAVSAPPAPSPYDDLLCTICNLKACWMAPGAAGKASPSS